MGWITFFYAFAIMDVLFSLIDLISPCYETFMYKYIVENVGAKRKKKGLTLDLHKLRREAL